MKTVSIATFVFSVGLLCISACSPSTPTQINTNAPGGTTGTDGNFSYLFASSASHIYRSSDKGASWLQATVAGDYIGGRVFAVDGDNIFSASQGRGVFRSVDAGATWSSVNSGLHDQGVFSLLVIGDVLLAGSELGISRTTDDGISWTISDSANLTGNATNIVGMTSIGSIVYMAPEYGTGIFRSTDLGLSWQPLSVGVPYGVAKGGLATNGADLFLTTSDSGAYRSTDGGMTWPAIRNGPPMQLSTVAASGNNVYIGTYTKGLFRSTDRGNTWSNINSSHANQKIQTLLPRGTDLYSASNGPGVYVSHDSGITWLARNTGLTDSSIISVGTK